VHDPEGTLDNLCTQAMKIALAVQVHFKLTPMQKRISEEEDPSKEVDVKQPKVSWDMRRNSTFADLAKGRRFNTREKSMISVVRPPAHSVMRKR
jgi:hypothetical protein